MSIPLNKLRLLSGFSWDDLALLFDVSRSQIQYWSSGRQLLKFQENKVNDILEVIEYIDTGAANRNRKLLTQTKIEDKSCFDLLIAGEYEVVKNVIGKGGKAVELKSGNLSEKEQEKRKPPNILANALQDTIHIEVGRSRPAKVSKKN